MDYNSYPWPYNEPLLIPHYKSYYSNRRLRYFCTLSQNSEPRPIDLEKTKLLGNIFYNAETNESNLSLDFEISEEKECLIYCIGKVSQNLRNSKDWSYIGWYLKPDKSKGKYRILFDIPANFLHIVRK